MVMIHIIDIHPPIGKYIFIVLDVGCCMFVWLLPLLSKKTNERENDKKHSQQKKTAKREEQNDKLRARSRPRISECFSTMKTCRMLFGVRISIAAHKRLLPFQFMLKSLRELEYASVLYQVV